MFKKIYNALIIRTLDSIVKIDTLIEGLIVSTFGVLFSVIFYYVFKFLGLSASVSIMKVAVFAYLAVFFYHFVAYQWDKEKQEKLFVRKIDEIVSMAIGVIISFLCYLALLDSAIYLVHVFASVRTTEGWLYLFGTALPGLFIMVLPLVAWQKLCDITPIDEIVRRAFK